MSDHLDQKKKSVSNADVNRTSPRSALEALHPRSLKLVRENLQNLVRGRLWLKVLIAMVAGIFVGVLLSPTFELVVPAWGILIGNWLALPGKIFLSVVQMIVVPLVVASVIRGIAASENIAYLRKMGIATVAFFVVTTTFAILVGIGLALLTKPGQLIDADAMQKSLAAQSPSQLSAGVTPSVPSLTTLPETISGLLPTNPLGAMVNLEMLQVVIFSLIVGVALISMKPKEALPIIDLLGSLQEVCMTVVKWAMLLAPYAVFGLMAQITSVIGLEALWGMSVYVATVLAGLVLLQLVYLLIYFLGLKKSPLTFLKLIRETMLLAFSTSSSAAVMPLSMKTAEEKLGVRPSVSQFVIPLGATINMNGTALYQGVAAIFLAQVFGIQLSFGALVLLVVTAVGSSIGSPATPGVGIVILAMVLSSVGIPATGIALIIGVDRILDMSRTSVNVSGDLLATCIMDRYVGGERSAPEQQSMEEQLEREREKSQEDVILVKE